MHVHDNQTKTGGFVMAADEGQAFWFLNTLTINKVGSDDSQGLLSIVDHRVPAGLRAAAPYSPGKRRGIARPGRRVRGILRGPGVAGRARLAGVLAARDPARLHRVQAGPGRIIVVVSPGGFDKFVAAVGAPARDLRLPEPVGADPGPHHPARRCSRHRDPAPAAALSRKADDQRQPLAAAGNPVPARSPGGRHESHPPHPARSATWPPSRPGSPVPCSPPLRRPQPRSPVPRRSQAPRRSAGIPATPATRLEQAPAVCPPRPSLHAALAASLPGWQITPDRCGGCGPRRRGRARGPGPAPHTVIKPRPAHDRAAR